DVARRAREQPRGLSLAAGRDRIDVEIIRIARNVRGDGLCRRETRGRGYRRHDDVGMRDRICGRVRKPRADFLARVFEFFAFSPWKQDVPGGDGFHARLAQSRSDGLSGFAEPDETQTRLVAGHMVSLRCTL